MKHWIKLVIPVALGLVAAAMNYQAMTESVTYVVVKHAIAEGEPISKDALEEVSISFSSLALESAAIKWDDRPLIYDRPATRDLVPGDLLFKRDLGPVKTEFELGDEAVVAIRLSKFDFDPRLLKVGNEVGFFVVRIDEVRATEKDYGLPVTDPRVPTKRELLGPFRIVAVGAYTNEDQRLLSLDDSPEKPDSISIAVGYDEHSKVINRLGEAVIIAKNQNAAKTGGIKGMVLFKSATAESRGSAELPTDNS